MTKRQLKKAAYTAIVKEGRSHQVTFNSLRTQSDLELETLANEVAAIPSKDKSEKYKTLRYLFVGILVLLLIIRGLGIAAFGMIQEINPPLLLVLILLGIVVPALGIYGVFTSKVDLYKTTGILLILGVVRSFSNGQFSTEIIDLLFLIPVGLAIGLAFFIPTKLKTPFTKKVVIKEVNGVNKKALDFVFDETKLVDEELLDVSI